MKSMLNVYDLLPVLLLSIQTILFLFGTITVLRLMKVISRPYAGMEYSKLIVAVAGIIAMMTISFCDIDGISQSVKTFYSYGNDFAKNLFIKSSQFILIIVIAECLFGFLSLIAFKILTGSKRSDNTEDDIAGAVLQATIILIVGFLVYSCAREIIDIITPKYISFL